MSNHLLVDNIEGTDMIDVMRLPDISPAEPGEKMRATQSQRVYPEIEM